MSGLNGTATYSIQTNDPEYPADQHSEARHESPTVYLPETKTPDPFWKNLIYEPILFCFVFVTSLGSTPTTNLYMDRACALNLNYSNDLCQDLNNHSEILKEVETIANDYTLYATLVKTVPAVILIVFIGPWSDKYGAKTPVCLALVGFILTEAGMVVFAMYESYPLYYSLLALIPTGITAGHVSIISGVVVMALKKSSTESRTMKVTILHLLSMLGLPLGTFTSGYLYGHYGYVPIYSLALGGYGLMLVYVILVIQNTPRKQASLKIKILDFFSCENVKENLKTLLKVRENNGRKKILYIFLAIFLTHLGNNVTSAVYSGLPLLFCKRMYDWNFPYFSLVTTVVKFSAIVLMAFLVPLLTKVWKCSDPWLGILGNLSKLGQSLVTAFAYVSWMYYIALTIGLPEHISIIALNTSLSKLVDNNELGKIFFLVKTLEEIVPALGALLFNSIYDASIDFFPGLIFLVESGILIIPLGVFIWLIWISRTPYTPLIASDEGGPQSTDT